ncbi:MAG: PP2C family protein-serine/threonine phosphatase [Acidobacteriota bacterium]
MKLRNQLILAFLLFAVVPLSGLTFYSFVSSQKAFREGVQAEAAALAEDMGKRMDSVTHELDHRVKRLARLPLQQLLTQEEKETAQQAQTFYNQLLEELGESVSLLDSLQVELRPPKPDAPPIVIKFPDLAKGLSQAPSPPAAAPSPPPDGGPKREPKRMRFDSPVRTSEDVRGHFEAHVNSRMLLGRVLSRTKRDQGEIPFAFDDEGHFFSAETADLSRLESLDLFSLASGTVLEDHAHRDWIIVTKLERHSGITFGIARPIGESLQNMRQAALSTFGLGLGMITLAMFGILPISGRMTRNLSTLAEGVDKLARGDLEARVPVKPGDEFGRLAVAFNRMAEDLTHNQEQLLEQERLRRELEMSRQIQQILLPRTPLRLSNVEAKGVSMPAREVGGDFFNYFALPGGDVVILIGDVSGKGIPAALLMAHLQATLQARVPVSSTLALLAEELDREIAQSTAPETYLTLFLGILSGKDGSLRYLNAGHNSQYVVRSGGQLDKLDSTGRPLGLLPGGAYEERSVQMNEGDSLFLYTDGLEESAHASGEEFGIERIESLLVQELSKHGKDLNSILTGLEAAVNHHLGDAEAWDDATMVLLRVGGRGQAAASL